METVFPDFFNFSAWLPPFPGDEEQNGIMLEILSSTDWKQPWLIGVIVFHLSCLVLSLCLRKSLLYQCVMMILLTGLALASEILNEYASLHWKSFANDAYFDSAGLFITFIFNMPILVNIFVIVILAVLRAGNDLIELKRLELQEKAKKTK